MMHSSMVRKKNSGLMSIFSLVPSFILVIGVAILGEAKARRFMRPLNCSAASRALSKSNGCLEIIKHLNCWLGLAPRKKS